MSQRDKSALFCIMEMPHPHDERRANLPLKQTLSRHWFSFQRERSTVERVKGRLKDEFGGRHLRVRGPGKVWCHLMFGILALTVEQLMRLTL